MHNVPKSDPFKTGRIFRKKCGGVKEFFGYCLRVFPFPVAFVLTDNGSEFAKHFSEELKRLHLTHYHTYPKTPKMNAHVERFNRTIQEEFANYHIGALLEPDVFNRKLIDWLVWYNTVRVTLSRTDCLRYNS